MFRKRGNTLKVELINYTSNPVYTIEQAASVCYDSTPSEDGKIMKQCYQSGHESVLEHASFTFRIEGVSRAATHQLVRHRTAKFSQRSQRYCSETDLAYVIPDKIKNNPTALAFFERAMKDCGSAYRTLQSIGISNEDARAVLPNACESVIYVTFDARNLLHFMNERLCTCAQKEIRDIALGMKAALREKTDCQLIADMCVPKCERGKVKYCNEPPKRSCGRQPLAKELNALIENNLKD